MKTHIKNIFLGSVLLLTTNLYAKELPGLWLGIVEVDKVNEVHSASTDANTPQEVKYPFNLQLVLHMDASDNTKLLKEVYIMQIENNGTRVLVTDEKRLSDFEGIIRKGDNRLVPVRLTSPSFDFNSTKNILDLKGEITSTSSTIEGKDVIHEKLHPTNPFRHQFHPNHKTGRDITRSFKIIIEASTETAGTGTTASNVGTTRLTGRYEETLLGLHKAPLKVSGNIILTLVSKVTTLNHTASGGE